MNTISTHLPQTAISRSHLGMGRAAGGGEKGKTGLLSLPPPELHTQHGRRGWHTGVFIGLETQVLTSVHGNEEKWGSASGYPSPERWDYPGVNWPLGLRRGALVPSLLGAGLEGWGDKSRVFRASSSVFNCDSLGSSTGWTHKATLLSHSLDSHWIHELHEPLHETAVKCTNVHLPRISYFNAHFPNERCINLYPPFFYFNFISLLVGFFFKSSFLIQHENLSWPLSVPLFTQLVSITSDIFSSSQLFITCIAP